ncbi:MAG: ComEC/Rec2 family competence protein, partial [Planctomycetota bacterium]
GLILILRCRPRTLYAAVLAGALLGWIWGIEPAPPAVTPGETTIEGTVVDQPVVLALSDRSLSADPEAPTRVSFTLKTDAGRVRVYRHIPPGGILRGDTVRIEGRLAPPREPTNPGQRDYAKTLRRRGISGVMRSYERHEMTIVPGGHVLRPLDRVRDRLRASLHEHCEPDTAGLLSALVLGYRQGLSPELVTRLQRSGTAHFLAISGLHLGLVFGIFLSLTLLLGLRSRTRTWTLLAILLAYVLLTGMNVAVLRAFIMIAVFLAGRLLYRRRDALTSLAVAALIITIFDPMSVHEVSFQLSFVAVLGIFWAAPIFHDFLGAPAKLGALFAVSLSAWLATAPLIQGTFHLVTPLVIFANLFLWPIVALLIAVGLLFLVLAWTPLAGVLGWIASALLSVMSGIAGGLEQLAPVSFFYSPGAAPAVLVAYFVLLAAWATWCRISPSPRKALLCAPIALLLAIPLFHRERVEDPLVAQLDVGRGLCTYVELPYGTSYVFDCGSLDFRDPGASVLAPYLWSRGVRDIHTVFISHGDADHCNGLRSVVERFNVRRIVTTPYADLPLLPPGVRVERIRVEGTNAVAYTKEGFWILSPPVWEEVGRPVPS